ncbi:hypothetical protein HN51_009073, partial [Arachis hypogaea]
VKQVFEQEIFSFVDLLKQLVNSAGVIDGTHICVKVLKEDVLKYRGRKSKFYLAYAGYMLRAGFIIPYQSIRYHLKKIFMTPS